MPITFEVGSLSALTVEEVDQIKKYIEQDTILDVQLVDSSGEVMLPVSFKPETKNDDGAVTANAIVTVIKNGSVVKVGVAPIEYSFTSYASDKTTKLADGKVVLTGEVQVIDGDEYKEVEVTENDFEWAIGHKYLIIGTATADGTTKYPLYETNGTDTHMWVTVAAPA